MMKKVIVALGIVSLSLLITFVTFETMSWYHFGDMPTKIVLLRLVVFFVVMVAILTGIVLLVNKLKSKGNSTLRKERFCK